MSWMQESVVATLFPCEKVWDHRQIWGVEKRISSSISGGHEFEIVSDIGWKMAIMRGFP